MLDLLRSHRALIAFGLLFMVGCASMGTRLEPPEVALIGIEPLASEGNLEQRLLLRVRVTNPNDVPLEFDGIELRLDLNGQRLGRALSGELVTIGRLDDGVVELIATTDLLSILRQIVALPGQDGIDYAIRGRIFLADSAGWLRVSREGRLADLTGLRNGRFSR